MENNTPQSVQKEVREEIDLKVNTFISEWCLGNVVHLIDTDDNAGEKLRQDLYSVVDRISASVREETLASVRETPAFENLNAHHSALDADGIMVAVSRQALDELLSALQKLSD